jgi:AAHS family 4-hydroxybenzoate transporter-like MFS transporter
MTAEGLFGLLLGCGSSGLIALSAITYPIAIRSTGVGWATGIGRLGSVAGPLAVGQMAGAQWEVPTIFLAAGGSVLIGAAASALIGLIPRADTPEAPAVVSPASSTASLHA